MGRSVVQAQGATYMQTTADASLPYEWGQPALESNLVESRPAFPSNVQTPSHTGTAQASSNPCSCEYCGSRAASSYLQEPLYDTDTESDDENEFEQEFAALVNQQGVEAVAEELASAYLYHRRRYRKFVGKHSRRTRFQNRLVHQKRSGRPFGASKYLCSLCSTQEDLQLEHELVAFRGPNKSAWRKDFPRKNPVGRDGKVMRCSECDSEYHLRRHCKKSKQSASSQTFPSAPSRPGARMFVKTLDNPPLGGTVNSQSFQDTLVAGGYHATSDVNAIATVETSYEEEVEQAFEYFAVRRTVSQRTSSENVLPVVASQSVAPQVFSICEEESASAATAPQQLAAPTSADMDWDSFLKSMGHFPWMLVDDTQEQAAYNVHLRTRLPSGRIGLLVDPGAYDNLCGSKWAESITAAAQAYNLHPNMFTLSKAIGVEGVGKEAQAVTQGISAPVAMDSDASISTYTAPCVKDSYLPALLGLKTLEAREGVLDTRVKERKLYMGPVQIVPLPGRIVHHLEKAPSGHLILPCDAFAKLIGSTSNPTAGQPANCKNSYQSSFA